MGSHKDKHSSKHKKSSKEKKRVRDKERKHKKDRKRRRSSSSSSSDSGSDGGRINVNRQLAMGRAAARATREILAYNHELRKELREVRSLGPGVGGAQGWACRGGGCEVGACCSTACCRHTGLQAGSIPTPGLLSSEDAQFQQHR